MPDIRVAKCGACGLRYAERGGIFAGACSTQCWSVMPPQEERNGRIYKRWQKQCRHCARFFTPKDKSPSKWRWRRFCSNGCKYAYQSVAAKVAA
jgi:hypothetical protein